MSDEGFTTFLADARSLDPTISADSACCAWMALVRIRTLLELHNADLRDDEWRVMQLAIRGFFNRVGDSRQVDTEDAAD